MPYLGNTHIVGDSVNNFKVLDDISSYTATFDGSASSVVSTAAETIKVVEHRFVQGQRVTYNNGGGSNIGGLSSGTAYFVTYDTANTIKLATSLVNANNNTNINLTSVGSGTAHTLTAAFDGVNKKFRITHGSGTRARFSQASQLNIAINNVIQKPNNDYLNFSEGFAIEVRSIIVFQTAPTVNDIFFGSLLGETLGTFDLSDHKIDNHTADGSTTNFNLSRNVPNVQSLLVTLDGVLQHPSDATTSRSYSLSADNIIEFTAAPASGVQIQIRHLGFAGAATGEVSGFYGRTGNVGLTASDHITTGDITSRNINASGIVTASSFIGDGSGLIGVASTDNIVTGTAATFNTYPVDINAGMTVAGVSTFAAITATSFGAVSGTTGTFSGNVSIGGVLTYEDVKNIDAVGIVTAREGIFIPDNKKLEIGNVAGSGDIQIYHNGSASYIDDVGTGSLIIKSSQIILRETDGTNMAYFKNGGAVELNFDNNKKLETSEKGIQVGTGVTIETNGQATYTGIVTAQKFVGDGSTLTGIDATQIVTGNTSVQTVDTGSDGHIKLTTEGTERLRITNDGKYYFTGTGGGSGSRGLEIDTETVGATDEGVILNARASGTTGKIKFQTNSATAMTIFGNGGQVRIDSQLYMVDDKPIYLGASNDLSLFHQSGGTSVIRYNHTVGSLSFRNNANTEMMSIGADGKVGVTTTGAFKVPAGTTAQRPGSAVAGDLRFNSTSNTLEFYTGSGWLGTNLLPSINSVTGTIYGGQAGNLVINANDITSQVDIKYSNNSTGAVIATDTSPSISGANITSAIPAAVYNTAAGTVIKIEVVNSDGSVSTNSVTKTIIALPSGGTKTTSGGYTYHTFTSSGTFANTIASLSIECLVVAGGGGGGSGDDGGGGGAGAGAGGLIDTSATLSTGNYTVTVGGGGQGGNRGGSQAGANGSNSSFNSNTAIGGGRGIDDGGGNYTNGIAGGSGGGGFRGGPGGSGTSGQGSNGGSGSGNSSKGAGGGGGGRSSTGQGAPSIYKGGYGGSGYNWKSLGTSYAGGGGGGGDTGGDNAGGAASSGGGAGTAGGYSGNNPNNGTANRGGGGGGTGASTGAFYTGSNGGSGIVIIRYQL